MFPVVSQRLLILIAAVVGGVVLLLATPAAMAGDRLGGLSLFDGGPGLIVFALAMIPPVALAVVVAALGNPLSGLFVWGVALLFAAIGGGSINGWLWRHGEPTSYYVLLAEMVMWAGALVGVAALSEALRGPIRRALPRLATDDVFSDGDLGLRLPGANALLAGVVCAGVGGALVTLMLTASDTGQAVGALILSFMLAALFTQTVVQQPNPLPLLLAPAVVAVAGYLHVPLRYPSAEGLMAAWYAGGLWGPALALPVHHLAAGVVGVTLGLGLSQSIEHSRQTLMGGPD